MSASEDMIMSFSERCAVIMDSQPSRGFMLYTSLQISANANRSGTKGTLPESTCETASRRSLHPVINYRLARLCLANAHSERTAI